jgi:hypothetical protein
MLLSLSTDSPGHLVEDEQTRGRTRHGRKRQSGHVTAAGLFYAVTALSRAFRGDNDRSNLAEGLEDCLFV